MALTQLVHDMIDARVAHLHGLNAVGVKQLAHEIEGAAFAFLKPAVFLGQFGQLLNGDLDAIVAQHHLLCLDGAVHLLGNCCQGILIIVDHRLGKYRRT